MIVGWRKTIKETKHYHVTKLYTLEECRRGNHLQSYAFLNFFLSASTNDRPVWGVMFLFKTQTILPLIVQIPTKISALPKKINHRQQMYDSSKHSCHSIARPRSPSKLAGVPTQNDHSVAFWI